MSAEKNKHIAVIGAGIIGINCAIELLQRGYQVTLIDKNDVAEGCSKQNAGHFATEQVFPLANKSLLWQLPKMLLDPLGPVSLSPKHVISALPWFIKFIANMSSSKRYKNTQALKNLNAKAIDYYKPLLEKADSNHLFIEKGSLLVFEQTPLKNITALLNKYLAESIPVKLLNREETLELEPNLHKNIQYSLYFTDVAHTVNPYLLCKNLYHYATSIGCKFEKLAIETIQHQDSYVEISGDENKLTFDHIVLATGAFSEKLLNRLGYKLPIEAERGYSLDLNQNESMQLNRPVASAERQFIITPMEHGLRCAGTAEFAGLTKKANMKRATMLHKNAQFILNKVPSYSQSKGIGWMGCRPSLPDSLPVISKATYHPNITFALGHQHLGLTLGAVTARLVGQIIDNNETDIDISPFSISRFN